MAEATEVACEDAAEVEAEVGAEAEAVAEEVATEAAKVDMADHHNRTTTLTTVVVKAEAHTEETKVEELTETMVEVSNNGKRSVAVAIDFLKITKKNLTRRFL